MATVQLCHDERLDRRVAVKRLHSSGPAQMEGRFVREAKLGASLNHPGLVSVFDTEVDDEGVLIVMEYVEGESLSEALRRGPLSTSRVARLARDLGDALDHAHVHSVVHRDVKPANVLLRDDGVTKLADLGIAVAVDQTRITRSGTVLGSAAYMAPEQLEGRDIGPAADVYAMAVVCFEALTGARAREGATPMEIAHRIATSDPPELREHLPSAPAEAAEALTRGMARDPAERPKSAGELGEAVASGLERPSRVPASRVPPPARTTPTAALLAPVARRRRFGRALAPAVLLLAVAAVAAAVLLSRGDGGQGGSGEQPSGSRAEEQPAQRPPEERAEKAPAEQAPAEQAPAESTPSETAPSDQGVDPERGVALNEQGFELMGQGDYAGAVPVLQQAVASWPEDSGDLEYAYALYNLGASLNRSGRPAEAIPYLEKRLGWANQRGVVKQELKAAKAAAGG
jgi:eukaryotic-like serine/threonine-protein kinase